MGYAPQPRHYRSLLRLCGRRSVDRTSLEKGKNNSRSDTKVNVRAELVKAASRFTNRSHTISRERVLKAVADRKKRYTHSPGCNARRAGNRCSDDDHSVAKSLGTVLRRVMMDVDIQHKDESIGNQVFSQVLVSAHSVIDDLRRELAKHRDEALQFHHGAGRAEQEIEVPKKTKESYSGDWTQVARRETQSGSRVARILSLNERALCEGGGAPRLRRALGKVSTRHYRRIESIRSFSRIEAFTSRI